MKKKLLQVLILLLYSINIIKAQQATLASGGVASGGAGNISYSIGQVNYTAITGSTGNVNQGMQQAFEIFTLTGKELIRINLQIMAYPNPTTSFVNLKIDGADFQGLSYQLIDLNGKEIQNQQINNAETNIQLENLFNANYLLKVNNNSTTIKIFKIIKNN